MPVRRPFPCSTVLLTIVTSAVGCLCLMAAGCGGNKT